MTEIRLSAVLPTYTMKQLFGIWRTTCATTNTHIGAYHAHSRGIDTSDFGVGVGATVVTFVTLYG